MNFRSHIGASERNISGLAYHLKNDFFQTTGILDSYLLEFFLAFFQVSFGILIDFREKPERNLKEIYQFGEIKPCLVHIMD